MVLLMIGIDNAIIHVCTGLIASFVLPVIVAIIASKVNHFNFFIYPNVAIKNWKSGAKKPHHHIIFTLILWQIYAKLLNICYNIKKLPLAIQSKINRRDVKYE